MPIHVVSILVDAYFQDETNLKVKKRVCDSQPTSKTRIGRFCFFKSLPDFLDYVDAR